MHLNEKLVHEVLENITCCYRGPGGAIAVVKDGQVVDQRVWGYADIDARVLLTPKTVIPVCSITKQFVCALLLDLKRNPTPAMIAKGDVHQQFSGKLSEILDPEMIEKSGLTLNHLCDMQSGLRDYWAITTLVGARPDDRFTLTGDCPHMVDRTKSFHFRPGNEYSYSNINFHILARVIELVSEEPLGKLLAERILGPAGMTTASLCPDTSRHASSCVGYEGDEERGFFPAMNRIEWSGDAGLVASLADMIAYERHLDHSHCHDPRSWYHEMIKPHTFDDGKPASYRYGLSHLKIGRVDTWGHGGALRGYRLHRRHAPEERMSVIVLFNHEANAAEAAESIFRGLFRTPRPDVVVEAVKPAVDWFGNFLDKDTQLVVTVSKAPQEGQLLVRFARSLEAIMVTDETRATSSNMTATIDGDSLQIYRTEDNLAIEAKRLVSYKDGLESLEVVGHYHCGEIDSTFHCSGDGEMLYGAFDGCLGRGPASSMRHLGKHVWALACPRGLDAPAPGNWTLVFRRDESGLVNGFVIGCWLARGLEFVKRD